MKKLLAALLLGVVCLLKLGCGGAGTESAAPPAESEQPAEGEENAGENL